MVITQRRESQEPRPDENMRSRYVKSSYRLLVKPEDEL
jgi:hypothetical protein